MAPARRPAPTGPTLAFLYDRVSTLQQERDGSSLAAQLAECRQYIARHGWTIHEEYSDTESGKRDDRSDYQRLLADVRRLRADGQACVIVTAALDRFGRRLAEQLRCREECEALGVPVHFVREGGVLPELTANLLAVVAQDEVKRLGRRVSAVKQHLLAQGWHPGGRVPWGYRLREATPDERALGAPRRVLVVEPVSAPYVLELYRLVADGHPVRRAGAWARDLPAEIRQAGAAAGRQPRTLAAQSIYAILTAAVYLGRVTADGPPAHWPALVPTDIWQAVQTRLASHRQVPRQASGRYLLTGFLRCPWCGGRMQGMLRKDRSGTPQRTYSHNGDDSLRCRYGIRPGAALEAEVRAQVQAALRRVAQQPRARLERAWRAQETPTLDLAPLVHAAEYRQARANARLTWAITEYADGRLDRDEYQRIRDGARSDLEHARAELARLAPTVAARTPLPPLATVLGHMAAWMATLATGAIVVQREVLAQIVRQVVPVRVARGRYRCDVTWTPLGEALARLGVD